MNWATASELAEHLGLSAGQYNEALFDELLAASRQAIQTFTCRTFEAGTKTEQFFDDAGLTFVYVKDAPIDDTQPVTVKDLVSGEVISDGCYTVVHGQGLIVFNKRVASLIEVQYTYSVGVPAIIKRAQLAIAAFMWQTAGREGMKSIQASPDLLEIQADDWPQWVKDTLTLYRRCD